MNAERPSLAWLADGDELRQGAAVWRLLRVALSLSFGVAGLLSLLLLQDRGSAVVWILFALWARP